MKQISQYDLDGLGAEFVKTREVESFLADFLNVKHCVMVNSGTSALFCALRAVGAQKVGVSNLTMIASATAAELAGCEIHLVSNNELPKGIDTFIHVSLNGRPCGIKEVLVRHPDITVVEDSCQSLGSQYEGKYLGTFGKVGCFSFSPHKLISAGNGGCVITDDEEIATSVRKLKNFGRESGGTDTHESIGYNFKFADIQAEFMLPQLEEIEDRIERRKYIYKLYSSELEGIMKEHSGTPWFVDVYVENRDELAAYLKERGIGTRAMYPLLSEQPPFRNHPVHGDQTQDMQGSHQGLWLPSSPGLSDEQIGFVIDNVSSWLQHQ